MRMFPIMLNHKLKHLGPTSIPWAMLDPHDKQAQKNHGGQTLERLAVRGGLCPSEALAVLDDREWHSMDQELAQKELASRFAEWAQTHDPVPLAGSK